MDSVNLETLRQAVAWQAAGLPVTLATVVRTWGSSPRPEGALLAICGDGRLAGSVSGGCIEDDLGDRLRTQQLQGPEVVTYGLTADWWAINEQLGEEENSTKLQQKIIQRYAFHKAKVEAEKQGFTIDEEAVDNDGTIKLTVSRW